MLGPQAGQEPTGHLQGYGPSGAGLGGQGTAGRDTVRGTQPPEQDAGWPLGAFSTARGVISGHMSLFPNHHTSALHS